MKITNEERIEKYKKIIEGFKHIHFYDISQINHSPHRYTIGEKHIAYASDNYGGRLGEETLKAVPCAIRGCNLSYDEHFYETVIAFTISEETEGINTDLKSFVEQYEEDLNNDKIDGFIFIEKE